MRHDAPMGSTGGTATAPDQATALGIGVDPAQWSFNDDRDRATQVLDALAADGFNTITLRSIVSAETRDLVAWTVEAYSDGPAWSADQVAKLAGLAEEHGAGFVITCQHAADQTFYAAQAARLIAAPADMVLSGDPTDTGLVARFI